VRAAEEAALLRGRLRAEREAVDVVDLHLVGRAADSAAVDGPLALALVPLPDGAADVGGDVAGARLVSGRGRVLGGGLLRGGRLRSSVLHEPAPLRRAVEEEVEAGLEDLLLGRPGMRVGERVAGRVELAQEVA
jgi:hypothetical protein